MSLHAFTPHTHTCSHMAADLSAHISANISMRMSAHMSSTKVGIAGTALGEFCVGDVAAAAHMLRSVGESEGSK